MRKVLLILFAALFLLAACSDDDEESTTTVTGSDGEAVALNGTWTSACFDDGSDGATLSIGFGGSSGTFTFNIWGDDTTCGGGATTPNVTVAGAFSYSVGDADLGPTKDISSGETVNYATTTDTAETVTANDQATADFFNQGEGAYCFTDWQVGVPKNVLGIDDEVAGCPTETVEAEKDIFYVDNTVTPNTLQVGLDPDEGGLTLDSAGYPSSLNPNVLTKQ